MNTNKENFIINFNKSNLPIKLRLIQVCSDFSKYNVDEYLFLRDKDYEISKLIDDTIFIDYLISNKVISDAYKQLTDEDLLIKLEKMEYQFLFLNLNEEELFAYYKKNKVGSKIKPDYLDELENLLIEINLERLINLLSNKTIKRTSQFIFKPEVINYLIDNDLNEYVYKYIIRGKEISTFMYDDDLIKKILNYNIELIAHINPEIITEELIKERFPGYAILTPYFGRNKLNEKRIVALLKSHNIKILTMVTHLIKCNTELFKRICFEQKDNDFIYCYGVLHRLTKILNSDPCIEFPNFLKFIPIINPNSIVSQVHAINVCLNKNIKLKEVSKLVPTLLLYLDEETIKYYFNKLDFFNFFFINLRILIFEYKDFVINGSV